MQPRGLGVGSGLSARDMVVPLGRNTPPEVLQQQGAQNDWMPAPDTIDPPSSNTMLALVAEQIGKMNGRASPGFNCVAASFIKNAVVVRPKPDGRGSERVNVLAPYIAWLFNLLYDKACIPACWKQAKLSPFRADEETPKKPRNYYAAAPRSRCVPSLQGTGTAEDPSVHHEAAVLDGCALPPHGTGS